MINHLSESSSLLAVLHRETLGMKIVVRRLERKMRGEPEDPDDPDDKETISTYIPCQNVAEVMELDKKLNGDSSFLRESVSKLNHAKFSFK